MRWHVTKKNGWRWRIGETVRFIDAPKRAVVDIRPTGEVFV
jgi:hypothetical protein